MGLSQLWRPWPEVPAELRHFPSLPLLLTHASQACRALQVPSGWSALAGWSRPQLKWLHSFLDEALCLPFHLSLIHI